ncbi:MAG: DUF3656 domain-containing protein, partial [Clostridia bacterium]|nr:DUF3656 domain-containing protein [Clostridia bacterium]
MKYIPFNAIFSAKIGDFAQLSISACKESVSVKSEVRIDRAVNRITQIADIESVLNKDCTEFKLNRADIDIDGDCFIPMSLINTLRKKAIQLLKENILNKYNNTCLLRIDISEYSSALSNLKTDNTVREINNITVMSDNADALSYVSDKGSNCVLRINDFKTINFSNILKSGLFKNNSSIFLAVPKILRLADMQIFKSFLDKYGRYFYGLYCDNIGAVY